MEANRFARLSESVWQYILPRQLVQVNRWISIQRSCYNQPKATKSITLTPTPLASPLPQAIVHVANKPVGDQPIELRIVVPF